MARRAESALDHVGEFSVTLVDSFTDVLIQARHVTEEIPLCGALIAMPIDFVAGSIDEHLQQASPHNADASIGVVLNNSQRSPLAPTFRVEASAVDGHDWPGTVDEDVSGSLIETLDVTRRTCSRSHNQGAWKRLNAPLIDCLL